MSESQPLENISADNEESLQTLLRAIALSQGDFSLILVVCNYAALCDRMAQRLLVSSSVKIEKIELGKFVPNLYSTIVSKLGEEKPPALMVFGLEAVDEIDRVLTSANYVREEFRKNLPFPVLLWVNDEAIEKFIRLAPDIFSWSTTVELSMTNDELIELIRQRTNQLFATETNFYLNLETFSEAWREIAAAERDLQNRQAVLLTELEACLQVWHGLNDFTNNRLDEALENYQESFLFWQQENHRERQGILLLAIAECYKQKAIQQRVKNQEFWQEEKYFLWESLKNFERSQRLDLVAKHISKLGEVLRRLQAWPELKSLVEKKAIKLHLTYGDPSQLAQDRGFLAQVSLEESRWDEAKQQAEAALKILAESPLIQPDELQEKGFYQLILAFSLRKLGEKQQADEHLSQAFRESKPQYEPQLYINILGKLRELYFQQRDYGKAFEIKVEEYAIQYHYNFLAFAGVAHFTAKSKIINSTLTETAKQAIVEREISGREPDVKRLWARISADYCKLIVIYGQSGVGKSSLVRAKLFPKLQQEKIDTRQGLPVLLRFYNGWVKTLGDNLRKEFQEVTGENLSASLDSPEEIIQQLQKNAELNLLTVLIFDQFEEFFFV
ncbi:ATP-binding protein, partial [Planktothrix sp. FACHB-1355]